MITVISSTKSLDLEREFNMNLETQPLFLKEVDELIDILKRYNEEELAKVMKISGKLAEVNFKRYRNFSDEKTINRQALFSFSGDVYKSINPFNYTQNEIEFAQKHLRILSGLYGVLRPLDKIKEYRLEMATKLDGSCIRDLYSYWTKKVTENIFYDVKNHKEKVILNLASLEYSKTIDRKSLDDILVYDVEFKENRNGQYKIVGTYAKKARGMMVSYIIKNAIDDIEAVKGFNEDGYTYNESLSTKYKFVFTR